MSAIKTPLTKAPSKELDIFDFYALVEEEKCVNNAFIDDEEIANIEFHKITFTNWSAKSSKFFSCKFNRCNFINCDLSGCELNECAFIGCALVNTDLKNCNLRRQQFDDNVWENVDISNSDCQTTSFRRLMAHKARMNDIDLTGGYLQSSGFAECELKNINFTKASCFENSLVMSEIANWNFRDMREFNLLSVAQSKLLDLDFSRIMTKSLALVECELRRCDFSYARIETVFTIGESVCDQVRFDYMQCGNLVASQNTITDCSFRLIRLEQGSFQESSITRSDFTEAVIPNAGCFKMTAQECLFNKADMQGAWFDMATLTNNALTNMSIQRAFIDTIVDNDNDWTGTSKLLCSKPRNTRSAAAHRLQESVAVSEKQHRKDTVK